MFPLEWCGSSYQSTIHTLIWVIFSDPPSCEGCLLSAHWHVSFLCFIFTYIISISLSNKCGKQKIPLFYNTDEETWMLRNDHHFPKNMKARPPDSCNSFCLMSKSASTFKAGFMGWRLNWAKSWVSSLSWRAHSLVDRRAGTRHQREFQLQIEWQWEEAQLAPDNLTGYKLQPRAFNPSMPF